MSDDIPYFFLDWDYETFSLKDDGTIYLDEMWQDHDTPFPEFVEIEGYLAPGYSIPRTRAKLVGDPNTDPVYELIKAS